MDLPRTLEKALPGLSGRSKAILVSGMRGNGKRVLLKHAALPGRSFASMASLSDRRLAENAPDAFFAGHPFPLAVEEIQRAPRFLPRLMSEADTRPGRGLLWLTCSERASLLKTSGDSLAGRMTEVPLLPMSLYEREGKGLQQKPFLPSLRQLGGLEEKGDEDTWRLIWQGAFPGVVGKPPRARNRFYEKLLANFLESDIRVQGNVGKLEGFAEFLAALASQTGQELRLTRLAQDASVNPVTAKRWLSLAESCGTVFLLPALSSQRSQALAKSPKVYFTDTGLAAYMLGYAKASDLRRDSLADAFYETFVIMEIVKSWYHNAEKPEFAYCKDLKKGTGVELLIPAAGKYHPVWIRRGPQTESAMERQFAELPKLGVWIGHGALICGMQGRDFLTGTVSAHSVWAI